MVGYKFNKQKWLHFYIVVVQWLRPVHLFVSPQWTSAYKRYNNNIGKYKTMSKEIKEDLNEDITHSWI